MVSRIAIGFIVWASILLSPCLLRAEGRFEIYSFKVEGEITNIISEDINEDGLDDLVVLHRDRSKDPCKRFLTIFWHDANRHYTKDNTTKWLIPESVAAVDVGDISPEKGRELVFITEDGVYFSTIGGNGVTIPKEKFKVQSLVAVASDRDAPYYNFVRDYTGDGRDDVLVCNFKEALFARQEKDYGFSMQSISLKPDIEIIAWDIKEVMESPENPFFRVAYSVPQVFTEDYNGDGLKDMLVSFRSRILIYEQDANGFSRDPVKVHRIKLFDDERRERLRSSPSPAIAFGDLDGDGITDIIAHETRGRIGHIESRTVLFKGGSPNIEKGKPDYEFKTENPVIGGAFMLDANGDGLKDLMMPTHAMSVWSTGLVLITGQTTLEWAYFIQKPDRTFSETPDRVITTELKFNVGDLRLESGIPNVVGDFNGDGCPDQALGESENLLGITLRDAEGKAMPLKETISVVVSTFNRVVDLNSDGLDDIILFYQEQPEYFGDLNILINKGPWTLPAGRN